MVVVNLAEGDVVLAAHDCDWPSPSSGLLASEIQHTTRWDCGADAGGLPVQAHAAITSSSSSPCLPTSLGDPRRRPRFKLGIIPRSVAVNAAEEAHANALVSTVGVLDSLWAQARSPTTCNDSTTSSSGRWWFYHVEDHVMNEITHYIYSKWCWIHIHVIIFWIPTQVGATCTRSSLFHFPWRLYSCMYTLGGALLAF
jgi:hypothetical protein